METLYPNPEPELSEIVVETTTACNIKCIHCASSNEGYIRQTLPYESFENIVSIMRKHKPLVRLNGHGETLTHRRFFDMLEASIAAGCPVVFQTNAMLLAPEVSKRLMGYAGADRLKSITISIDGVDEVFNTIRRTADWAGYVNNILAFRDLRAAAKSPYPELNFQFTAMLLNIHTLPAAVAKVKEFGGSGIMVGDLLEYPSAAGQSVTRDLAYARPFYEEAKRLAKELHVHFSPFPSLVEEMESVPYSPGAPLPNIKDEYATPVIAWDPNAPRFSVTTIPGQPTQNSPAETGTEAAGNPEGDQPRAADCCAATSASAPENPKKSGMVRVKDCTDPWKFAFVQPDGGIKPCCWISETMGNLNTESFEEIWQNQKYKDLRAAVAGPNPPQVCYICQSRGWKWIPEPSNRAGVMVNNAVSFPKKLIGLVKRWRRQR